MNEEKFDERMSMMFQLDLPKMPALKETEPIQILDMDELDQLVAAGKQFNAEQIDRFKKPDQ